MLIRVYWTGFKIKGAALDPSKRLLRFELHDTPPFYAPEATWLIGWNSVWFGLSHFVSLAVKLISICL